MSNTIALVKVLSKSMLSNFSRSGKKQTSNFGSKLGFLLFAGAMLACFIPLAISAHELSLGLGLRGSNLVVQFLILVMALLSLFMGLFTNISILFLSKDNDQLLYLPFKPREIFVARMIMSLVSSYLLIILFFVPSAIGVGIAQNASFMFYISVLVATLLVPIIPVIISSTILVVFVSIFKFLRNRTIVTYAIIAFSFILGFGVSYLLESYMPEITSETDVFQLITRYEEAINTLCQYLMFALPLIRIVDITVIWWMRILWLVVYVGLTTLFMFLAVSLSSKLYLRSLLNINSGVRKKKYSEEKAKKEIERKKSIFGVLLSNEKKSLFRNPMSFLNLVFPIVMPTAIAVILLTSVSNMDRITINSALPYVKDYYNHIVIAISAIFSITSMYSAVSYSKEGNNNFAMNYLPVSFMKVFLSKVVLGTILNMIPFVACMIAVYVVVDIDVLVTLHGLVCALLAIFTVNLIGVFIDINRPKLKWISEVEAVKNNMNIFYYMITAVLFYGVLILFCDYAGLIEMLVIVTILTIVSWKENHYRDKLC